MSTLSLPKNKHDKEVNAVKNNNKKESKKKVENVRSKLLSLRNIEPYQAFDTLRSNQILPNLEKSLEKHNKEIEDPEQDIFIFPKDPKQQGNIEDRLWHYFCNKTIESDKRIEKQKVNVWKKLLQTILRETNKKIMTNYNHLQKMACLIKSKYKQSHEIFKEIENIKFQEHAQNVSTGLNNKSTSRRKKGKTLNDRDEKIKILYENIESLKQEILEQEHQKKVCQQEIRKLEAQRKSLLLNFVKEEYYLQNGVADVFIYLQEIGYSLNKDDLPNILDEKSKQYLLNVFNTEQKSKKQNQNQQKKRLNRTQSMKPEITQKMNNFVKKQNLKEIYGQTRNYLENIIRDGTLNKEQLKLPKLNTHRTIQNNRNVKLDNNQTEEWKAHQKRRIQTAYVDQQIFKKAKKILFGTKLQTIFYD